MQHEMSSHIYMISALLTLFLVVFITRILPFLFSKKIKQSRILNKLALQLPPAILLLLVIHTLKDKAFFTYPYGIPEILGVLFVVLIHSYKKSLLISVVMGTVFYQGLVLMF